MINITKELISEITINISRVASVDPYDFEFINSVTKKIVPLSILDTSPYPSRYNIFSIPADSLEEGEGELHINGEYFDVYKCVSSAEPLDDVFYNYNNGEDLTYEY